MDGFVDIHSHLLPGIDDGPEDLDGALEMARAAAEAGTRTIAATPHVRSDFPRVRVEEVAQQCAALSAAVHAAGIALEIVPLRALLTQDVLRQVNASALLGRPRSATRQLAEHLCRLGWAHVIASGWAPRTRLATGGGVGVRSRGVGVTGRRGGGGLDVPFGAGGNPQRRAASPASRDRSPAPGVLAAWEGLELRIARAVSVCRPGSVGSPPCFWRN